MAKDISASTGGLNGWAYLWVKRPLDKAWAKLWDLRQVTGDTTKPPETEDSSIGEQKFLEVIPSYLFDMRATMIEAAYRSRDASTSSLTPREMFDNTIRILDDLEKIEHHIDRPEPMTGDLSCS